MASFNQYFLFFLLPLVFLPVLSLANHFHAPIALKLPLFHRDSPSSPIYDASLDRLQQFENAMQRSLDRAVSIFSNNSQNDIESRRKNGGNSSSSSSSRNPSQGNYSSPITASSEGDYVTTISLGTPPQTFTTMFVDTGSTLVWIKCSNSSNRMPNLGHASHLFEANKSSTFKILTCKSPRCRKVQEDIGLQADSCSNTSSSSQCRFQYIYVDLTGSSGLIAVDNLNLKKTNMGNKIFKDFAFGCALKTQGVQGDGGIGLDRGSYSLVSQLGPMIGYRFSYCLTSANVNASSSIFFGKSATLQGKHVVHTPLIYPNNSGRNAYYLDVRRISLGNRILPVPSEVFQVRDGSGGTVIDTGTTFVLLAVPVYRALMVNLILTVPYPQVFFRESLLGIPCFDISGAGGHQPELPNMAFHFRGGAKLDIPWQNLFFQIEDNIVCMSVQQSPEGITDLSIIGNRAQQNFHFLFDLNRNRMSFVKKNCTKVH